MEGGVLRRHSHAFIEVGLRGFRHEKDEVVVGVGQDVGGGPPFLERRVLVAQGGRVGLS